MRLPGRIARYAAAEMLRAFVFALAVFTALLFLALLTQLCVKRNALFAGLVLRFAPYLLPRVLFLALPMAVLTGAIMAFGRLAADGEVTALRACGLGPLSLAMPAAALGLAAGALALALNVWGTDLAAERVRSLQGGWFRHYGEKLFRPGETIPLGRVTVVLHPVDPKTGHRDVVLRIKRGEEVLLKVMARNYKVRLESREEGGHLVAHFTFFDAVVDWGDDGHAEVEDRLVYEIDLPKLYGRGPPLGDRPSTSSLPMNLARCRDFDTRMEAETHLLDAARAAGDADAEARHLDRLDYLLRKRTQVEFHVHMAFATAAGCLVLAIAGLAIGIHVRHANRLLGFSLGVCVVLLFYLLMVLGNLLSSGGCVPPWAGAHLPNLIVAAASAWALRRFYGA